ncbi:MAG: ABC transporter permease [Dictyoglomaceae bacterium]|nr:ABC transporter permease [Dictyoglomaceae bacterium]
MKYFINKIIQVLVMTFLALTVVFFIVQSMPGDPAFGLAVSIAQTRNMPLDKALEIAHKIIGYNPKESIILKYLKFLRNIITGNFGYSTYFKTSVNEIIGKALPWTLFVISLATAIGFFTGTTLGAFSAQKRGTFIDTFLSTIFSIIQAVPAFVLAVFILFIGAVRLRLLPLGGAYPLEMNPGFSPGFLLAILHHALGPLIATSIPQMASWGLAMRGNCSNILEEDFVRFAKIRGLPDSVISQKYIRKNAILPLVASLAIGIGYMLGGHTLVEVIFNYPGIGYYFGQAISTRDFGLLTGLFSLIVIGVILATFVTELLYIIIDPRVKVQ